MINKKLSRAIAATAGVGLAFASLVGISAPAQAADPTTTTFKVHLNVPKSAAEDWNIWSWGDCNGANDNTIGASDRTIGTGNDAVVVNQDWTPNFIHEDAYGAYAEFTVPCVVTALNNVMRTTESWDGVSPHPAQPSVPKVPAVADDPATPNVDESMTEAIPEETRTIPAADKPLGGDNIFPAGESWWDVINGVRYYPEKDVVSYKIHVNAPLATLQSQGWNIFTWGTTKSMPVLSATKQYKGKVNAATTGWPFTGSDKYGAFAIVQTSRLSTPDVGVIIRRSGGTSVTGWNNGTDNHQVQSCDFKTSAGNGLVTGQVDFYTTLGSCESSSAPLTFVGRFGATATYTAASGANSAYIRVTPVRPAHAALKGAYPDKVVVTAKKGSTTKTCTITSQRLAKTLALAEWANPSSCDIPVVAPSAADGEATWEITVQASLTGVGAANKSVQANAKVKVAPAA